MDNQYIFCNMDKDLTQDVKPDIKPLFVDQKQVLCSQTLEIKEEPVLNTLELEQGHCFPSKKQDVQTLTIKEEPVISILAQDHCSFSEKQVLSVNCNRALLDMNDEHVGKKPPAALFGFKQLCQLRHGESLHGQETHPLDLEFEKAEGPELLHGRSMAVELDLFKAEVGCSKLSNVEAHQMIVEDHLLKSNFLEREEPLCVKDLQARVEASLDKSHPRTVVRSQSEEYSAFKQAVTEPKQLLCDLCNESFSTKKELKKHEFLHSGIKPFKCKLCSKFFASSTNLKEHKFIHSGMKVKIFSCEMCGKSFTGKSDLSKHNLTHLGLKPFLCEMCGKSFTAKSDLIKHNFTHLGLKPFSCDVCSRSFTGKNGLNRHNLTHLGLKPFSCEVCSKSFTIKSNLTKHKMTHSELKPFHCDVCCNSYTTSGSLNRHKLIHSGLKPFSCNACGKKFALKGSLKRHKLTHSGEKHFFLTANVGQAANHNTFITHSSGQ